MLPAMALLLDRAWVDARVVALVGLSLMFVGALGDSFLDETWQTSEFFGWQALMAFGAPMVVMPLLMTATNAVLPDEGPFASALINTPRALAEITAIWLVALIQRERGAFHAASLSDSIGSFAFGHPLPPEAAAGIVAEQSAILATADAFRIVAGIAALMMLVVLLLPRRTYPPRIALAGVKKT
jgi:DHA2 family multidrug resistance protein